MNLSTESQNEPALNAGIYRKHALFGRPYYIRPISENASPKVFMKILNIFMQSFSCPVRYWYNDVYVIITLIAYANAIL